MHPWAEGATAVGLDFDAAVGDARAAAPAASVAPSAAATGALLNVHRYLRIARQGAWLFVACVLIGAALGAAAAYVATPNYAVRATVYVTPTGTTTVGELQIAQVYVLQKASTWATLATTDAVLESAVGRLADGTTVEELRETVSASARESTGIIDIAGSGSDPSTVATRTNSVALALIAAIAAPSEQPETGSITANAIALADVPVVAVSPQPRYNIAAGAVIGALLGIVLLIVRHALDTRIYSLHDVPTDPKYLLRAAVPPGGDGRRAAQRVDAMRRLRLRLQRSDTPHRSIAVLPLGAEADALAFARELCVVHAEVGLSAVLVNADLRPAAPGSDESPIAGVSQVLARSVQADSVVHPVDPAPDLIHAIHPGERNDAAAQLLSTTALPDLVAELRTKYSVVVIVGPPVDERADAAAISAAVETTLVLLRGGRSERDGLRAATSNFFGVGARAVGVVLEQAHRG